jgi:hypothetical protein
MEREAHFLGTEKKSEVDSAGRLLPPFLWIPSGPSPLGQSHEPLQVQSLHVRLCDVISSGYG